MVSSVSRMPAVSMNLKDMPLMSTTSSMQSLVVPCISDTMALSSCRRTFSSELLPTLVLPTMATGMPCFMALPVSKDFASFCILLSAVLTSERSSVLSANSSSSWSQKSSSSSKREFMLSSCSLSCLSSLLKHPLSWLIAILCVALLVDAIRSATASA